MKLNTDGSTMRNPKRVGGGGLIWDHDGAWLKGFARGLGYTNSTLAELWMRRDGLMLALEMGIQQLIIELDALSVVILMNNEFEIFLMEPLLTDCRNLLKEFPNRHVIHAYCEANQCLDALAKLGAQSLYSFAVFVTHRLWWRLFWLLIRLICIITELLILSVNVSSWFTKKKITLTTYI